MTEWPLVLSRTTRVSMTSPKAEKALRTAASRSPAAERPPEPRAAAELAPLLRRGPEARDVEGFEAGVQAPLLLLAVVPPQALRSSALFPPEDVVRAVQDLAVVVVAGPRDLVAVRAGPAVGALAPREVEAEEAAALRGRLREPAVPVRHAPRHRPLPVARRDVVEAREAPHALVPVLAPQLLELPRVQTHGREVTPLVPTCLLLEALDLPPGPLLRRLVDRRPAVARGLRQPLPALLQLPLLPVPRPRRHLERRRRRRAKAAARSDVATRRDGRACGCGENAKRVDTSRKAEAQVGPARRGGRAAVASAMLSQFFVLSPRGDTIISKDFRGDCRRAPRRPFSGRSSSGAARAGTAGRRPRLPHRRGDLPLGEEERPHVRVQHALQRVAVDDVGA